jgi:dihydroorotate dehydrogenase
MPNLYPLIRPALFRLGAETARDLAPWALRAGLGRFLVSREAQKPDSPCLAQDLWGLHFPNPVGLAAGGDKDARMFNELRRFGFGSIEVGTVTPRRQPGRSKPRLFRLDEDTAIINRMGFNSDGLDAVIKRLSARPRRAGIVGLNLGINSDSNDAATDYEEGIHRAAEFADYLVINVSSPNTPGLRDLQQRAFLELLLRRLMNAREATGHRVPLLVKIAPDLKPEERRDIATVALDTGIDGLVVSNTTVSRPDLVSRHAREAGGLSGRPLLAPSTALLADMYRLTQGRLPLIGVGGIASAADAYAKIRAGASLVQLYTALVFAGPNLVRQVKSGLADLLEKDGFDSIAGAVGTAHNAMPAQVLTLA